MAANNKIFSDSTGRRLRRPGALTALALLALTLLFFYRVFPGDLVFRDPFFEFYPLRLWWGYALNGEFALWDPLVGLGAPLSGSVFPALFYPLHGLLLYLLRLPADLAIRVYTVLHYWLAALSMAYLVRTLGARREAAATSAVAYAFSGYLVSMHYAQNVLPALALCPLALGLLLRARATAQPIFSVLAGAAAGLIFLGGDPQGFALTIALSLSAALCLRPAEAAPLRPARAALLVALFLATAVAAAGAELFPALAVFQASPRARGFDLEAAGFWSFHPARVLEFFLTRPFGSFWPINHYWPQVFPMVLSPYLGVWTLITAGLALKPSELARDRRVLFFFPVALLFLLLAFGKYFPLFGLLLKMVPGFSAFRFPEKYLLPVTLALAVLSGLGLSRLLESAPEPRPQPRLMGLWPAPIVLLAAAAVIAGIGFALRAPLGSLLLSSLPKENWTLTRPETAVQIFALSLVRALVLFAAGFWLLTFLRRSQSSRLALASALFLFADLFFANSGLAPTLPHFYRLRSRLAQAILAREGNPRPGCDDGEQSNVPGCGPPWYQFRQKPGSFRLFRPNNLELPPELSPLAPDGLRLMDQRDYLRWMRDTLKPNLGALEGLPNFGGISAALPERFLRLRDTVITFDRLPVFNVKYAIVPAEQASAIGATATVLERLPGVALVEFKEFFPRAYWIGAERRVADDRELAAAFADNDFRREVIISAGPEAVPPLPPANHSGIVPARIAADGPNRVTVEVTAPGPGWLVLSDLDFPGWSASLDGRPAKIFRANGLVRAARVTRGQHQVVFTFQPPGLFAGLAASTLALALVLGMAFIQLLPHKTRRRS